MGGALSVLTFVEGINFKKDITLWLSGDCRVIFAGQACNGFKQMLTQLDYTPSCTDLSDTSYEGLRRTGKVKEGHSGYENSKVRHFQQSSFN